MNNVKPLGTRIIAACSLLGISHVIHGILTTTDAGIWECYSGRMLGIIGIAVVVVATLIFCLWARRTSEQ